MMILINIIGLLLIAIIIKWFWFSRSQVATTTENQIQIYVKDGTYQPALIKIRTNQPITLRFIREDPQPCAETVIFSDLNISRQLPLDQPIDIKVKLSKPGEHEFTCQMGMYRGKLIAV